MKHPIINFFRKLNQILGRFESLLLVTFLALMLILSLVQIVARTGFNQGIIWIDPLCRSLILWIALIGGAKATHLNKNIKIDIVDRLLPQNCVFWIQRILSFIAFGLTFYLGWVATQFVLMEKEFGEKLLPKIEMWHIELALPLGFFLMAYHFTSHRTFECFCPGIDRFHDRF